MSIATELQNYADGLDDAYDAVNDMSGIIPQHKNMNNLDQAIRTIPQNTGVTATTFHWGGSPNYSMYKDSGYTTAATYSDIATAYADGLVYIADGEDEVTYVVVSDIPDAHTITVTGIALPGYEGGSTSYAYASSTWTKTATEFQKKLTAGTNIQINGTTISATDTTYSDMVGATSLDAGAHGLAPAPAAGDEDKVLSGAGTWVAQTAAQVNSDWNANSGVAQILNKPSLATVATSGDYTDLINTPTIPAAQIQSDWTQADNTKLDYIKNKPTIPTVNDATLTITQNGTSAGTFTANASSNTTIALTDTTYSAMTGATSGAAGTSGLVPAPAAGDEAKVLSGAGTWVNQPTVPTVNDATLTIQHNGTTVQTFTANQSSNATANIETIYADTLAPASAVAPIETAMIADGAVTSAKLSTTDLIPEVVNSSTLQEAWKFPDGKLICFGGKYNGYDITSSYEGAYFASTSSNLTSIFAVPFIDTPQVTVTLQYNSGLLGFNLTNTTTTGFSGYIWKSQSKSNVGITVRYIAIGRWK